LAMKVYGHLRDQHSVAMAQKVSFSVNPAASDEAKQLANQNGKSYFLN